MGRNGGAQGTLWLVTSIASAMFTVAATVQESLWNSLLLPLLLAAAVVELVLSIKTTPRPLPRELAAVESRSLYLHQGLLLLMMSCSLIEGHHQTYPVMGSSTLLGVKNQTAARF